MRKRIRGIAIRLLERGYIVADVCMVCKIHEASIRVHARSDEELAGLVQRVDPETYARWMKRESELQEQQSMRESLQACRGKRRSKRSAKQKMPGRAGTSDPAMERRANVVVSVGNTDR